MNLFRALSNRPFALLWSGQTISRVGDSLYRIALAWWVLEKTGSATAMGTVLIFSTVPLLIFLLIGGVVVDRLPRRRIMLASDLLLGVLVALVAVLAFSNLLQVWHIYLVSILFGFAEAFFRPAYTAILPDITPREELPSANSLTSLSNEIAGVGGPALGAAIVAAGGTSMAFALDAVSFFISAGCLLAIASHPQDENENHESSNIVRDISEGLGAVRASVWLWLTILMSSLGSVTLSGPIGVSMPFLIKNHLQANVGSLGLIYSMFSLGSVLSAVWLGSRKRLKRRGLFAYAAWLASGLALPIMGWSPWIAGVAAAAFVCGAGLGIGNLIWINLLQELVPTKLLGRVSSIDNLGSMVFTPIGYGVAGWATDLIGSPLVFVVSGVFLSLIILLCMIHPGIRNLD